MTAIPAGIILVAFIMLIFHYWQAAVIGAIVGFVVGFVGAAAK